MSLTASEMTPADIAAVTNNRNNCNTCNDGWGGGWSSWIILFLIFGMFGWGGFGGFGGGWGGNNAAMQGALTRADLCSEFNFNGLENSVRGVQQGICDSTYALNTAILNGFHGVDNAVCTLGYQTQQGFHGVDNAICNLGYQTQQGFNNLGVAYMQGQNAIQTQISDCCCKNQTGQMQLGNSMERGFCDINYAQATNTNAIIQNAHNDTDRVLAKLDAMEMARKDETIADLRTKLAACGDQTTAQYIINQLTGVISPRPVPAYPAASPCGLGNWSPQVLSNSYGYNNNCGCNSGCCGCNG